MGANKTKLHKSVRNQLAVRTQRSAAEIDAMYAIFLQHFPTKRIESPQDLSRCLEKFSLVPIGSMDDKATERIYRLFEAQNRDTKTDRTIDFFQFMIVSSILERGSTSQKIALYFDSFDVNNDHVITRDDLEVCLAHTLESPQIIQQLLRQWDVNRDGFVTFDDFERYIMANPDLLPMFVDAKDRVRIDNLTPQPPPRPTEHIPPSNYTRPTRDIFVTSP